MYSLELVVTVGIAAVIIGAVAGAAIAQRSGSSARSQKQMEEQLDELRQQAEHYQQEVSEHFNETALLLNQLTSSYRDVHNHLAKGAQTLAADSNATQTLKKLGADSDDDKADKAKAAGDSLTPPLDYAVKPDADQVGVLDEKFGLDDVKPAAKQADQA